MTATTCDGTALHAAILANPADDTARLVYADYLQEDGEEARAEFIRVQVALANGADWRDQLGCRSGLLLTRHGETWGGRGFAHTDDERECARARHACAWWSRGFIEAVSCTAADWLKYGDAILREHPVTKVRLTTVPDGDWVARNLPLDWLITGQRSMVADALSARWPHITLEFPA